MRLHFAIEKKGNFIEKNKECLHCSVEFVPIQHNQKFCCVTCRDKFRYQKEKESRLEYCALWRERNKEKLKEYYEKNKDKRKENTRKWNEKNKDRISEKNREWNTNNRERRNEINRNHYQRNKNNPKLRLSSKIRKGIYKSLRGSKDKSWRQLVDFTLEELEIHLKNTLYDGYTWQDYLDGKLHIDHIIPIALYNITDANCEEFKKCWSLKNLRLYFGNDNCSKQDALDWNLVKQYNLYDILPEIVLCDRKEKELV